MNSLPGQNLPPTSYAANRSTNYKVDLAIKHIKELREQIHEIKEDIGRQTRMEQQLLGAVSNVEEQLHCIMHFLPPAWQGASGLGSFASVYQTCQHSRRSSDDPESQHYINEVMSPEAARGRRQSLPATLHLPTVSKQQFEVWQTATTLRDKLDHIAEEPTDLSTQVR